MIKLITLASLHLRHFKKDEDGLALTEYLILLGLLTASVIAAVLLFGTELGDTWGGWAGWLRDEARLDSPDGDETIAD